MSNTTNQFGQPIGDPLPSWTPRPRPPRTPMEGRLTRVEPLDPAQHEKDLFEAYAADPQGKTWTYMAWGPFADQPTLRRWLEERAEIDDPLMFAIIDRKTGQASGVATFMRIDPPAGVIEVGGIAFAPRLQRSIVATEAMYLMMKRAFDELGYRRYEWKCDSLNQPSRDAAKRFGFRYEGTFSQATIYKGRNRDTAWFSITDGEWPKVRAAMETWLVPDNFDGAGRQIKSLSQLTATLSTPR
ncbi:MAG TPA: GNAT family protein [Magnetospirillaceae bacterium]|jgi:RimJ/RimL family protein N-acetyltransferase